MVQKFIEVCDYNCKIYFNANKNLSARNVRNHCKQVRFMPL